MNIPLGLGRPAFDDHNKEHLDNFTKVFYITQV